MLRRGALLALIALLASVGVASASQPIGPLTLEIEHSRPRCTSGTLTEASWTIRGGVPPYALSVGGETVDIAARSALVACGSAIDDETEWLLGIGNERRITARLTDAAGATVHAHAYVVLVAGREAPVDVHLASKIWAYDTWLVTAEWTPGHYQPWLSRSFLARWRIQGTTAWTYDDISFSIVARRNREAEWTLDASYTAQILEYQFADLRHPLEAGTPEALNWSVPETVTVAARPRDVTATATHDSISLSWGPDVPGLYYTAKLSHERGQPLIVGGGESPYSAHFDGLLPDTWYTVGVTVGEKFDVRTGPAPEAWSPDVRKPRNLAAELTDDGLQLTWLPPSNGVEYSYRVCAKQLGDSYWDIDCQSAVAGEHSVIFRSLPLGGSYDLAVTHGSAPPETTEHAVYVPYPEIDTPENRQPAPTPQVSHDGWTPDYPWWVTDKPDVPEHARFVVEWPDEITADVAEIEWKVNGQRVFKQMSRSGEQLFIETRDPIPFRVRYLQDGAWTGWSDTVAPKLLPSSPSMVWLNERNGRLTIGWIESLRPELVAGYRVYIKRDGEEVAVLEAGTALAAEYPIPPDPAEYQAAVAAYDRDGDEAPYGYGDYTRYEQGESFSLRLADREDVCIADPTTSISIYLAVSGGTGPFSITVDDADPFETSDRHFPVSIACDADDATDALHSATVQVTDRYGDTTSDTLTIRYRQIEPEDSQSRPALVDLHLRSVHDTHIWLSWGCNHWAIDPDDPVVLRWRRGAGGEWRYASQENFPYESYEDSRCRGRWSNLEPSTRYEYQLARYADPAQLESPGELDWTPTQTVTTLGPPSDVRLEIEDGGIAVYWRAHPEAWAYQIVFRTDDASWWIYHKPNGSTIERAFFRELLPDAEYSIEIISPPLSNGEEMLAPGFAWEGPRGH